jgi:hypothetical protein
MDNDSENLGEDTQALNQGAETGEVGESQVDGDTIDTNAKPPVPYSRFEEVVRANQEFRGTYAEQLKSIQETLAQLSNQKAAPQTEKQSWDERAKTSRNWDEFVGYLKADVFQEIEARQKEKSEQAEKELDQEVKLLYDQGLITSKTEENEVLDFAVKKSEQIGRAIPLSVAYAWWKESKPAEMAENKQVSTKIQSSKKSQGGVGKEETQYKDLRSKGLDEIVMEAKDNAPKE